MKETVPGGFQSKKPVLPATQTAGSAEPSGICSPSPQLINSSTAPLRTRVRSNQPCDAPSAPGSVLGGAASQNAPRAHLPPHPLLTGDVGKAHGSEHGGRGAPLHQKETLCYPRLSRCPSLSASLSFPLLQSCLPVRPSPSPQQPRSPSAPDWRLCAAFSAQRALCQIEWGMGGADSPAAGWGRCGSCSPVGLCRQPLPLSAAPVLGGVFRSWGGVGSDPALVLDVSAWPCRFPLLPPLASAGS